MSSIPVILNCPLGHKCEEVKDGAIHRCGWFVKIAGVTPDDQVVDEWRCGIAWQPILSVEMSMTNRGQTKAIEMLKTDVKNGNAAIASAVALASRPSDPKLIEVRGIE